MTEGRSLEKTSSINTAIGPKIVGPMVFRSMLTDFHYHLSKPPVVAEIYPESVAEEGI